MEGETKMIFCAVLCGNEAAELLVKSSNCVNLPVLLTAGNQVSGQGKAMSWTDLLYPGHDGPHHLRTGEMFRLRDRAAGAPEHGAALDGGHVGGPRARRGGGRRADSTKREKQ